MNQINIDSLLQIGSGTKIEQTLKLDPSQLYQALLQIGRDQSARLAVQTPQGPLQIPLPQPVAQQILQTAQQLIAAATPGALSPGVATTTGAATVYSASPDLSVQQMPPNGQQANATSNATNSATSNAGSAQTAAAGMQEAKVFVQLQPLGTDQLQLTVRLAGKTLNIPLQPQQLLQLLQQPAPQQHLSVQAQQVSSNPAQQVQWPVQLQRLGNQLHIQLPQGQPLQLALDILPEARQWPEQKMLSGRLELQVQQGALKLQLHLSPSSMAAAGKADATEPHSGTQASAALTNRQAQQPLMPQAAATVAIKPRLQQQLLPLLARQTWPEQLGGDVRQWLHAAKAAAPSVTPQSWLWQLKHPSGQQVQLELTPQTEPRQLKLAVSEIGRPFSFLNIQPQPAMPAAALQTDSRDLWRQWLPLSQGRPDLLADSPALPAAVRQLLQELRTQHPDSAKLQTQQQLMQQINAALQFNPLQTPAQPNSAAGGLALAIQLLLGRLGAQLPAERQNLPQKEKLQQLIGQLDRSQSAQVLRQLSGHSSQLQSAQIANVEHQSSAAQSQKPEQLLIQLPLLQQGESRFAELAISEREAEGAEGESRQRCWQLTMKFDLGAQGEMLVQVRLIGKEVSLQFYADNEKTLKDTGQFLPLLKDRLTMQGLQVAEAGCQLGKIPEHLYQRGTSLLQVRV